MRLQKDFDPFVYAKHFNARVAHYLALKKFAFEKPLVDTNARFFQMDNCLFRSWQVPLVWYYYYYYGVVGLIRISDTG